MKKIFSVILCAAALTFTACESEQERQKEIASYAKEQHEKEESEYWESRLAEIQEVDEWGISLDDVDRLAKQAIRKHENISDYREEYYTAINKTDTFLENIESEKSVEYTLENFPYDYNTACDAGIEFMKSCVDVKSSYDLFINDGEFDIAEKDLIRTMLELYSNSIEEIEQSKTDMEEFLDPIIDENRKLTDDELEKVFEIYQTLTDKVDIAAKYH